MSDEEHRELAETLRNTKAKVAVSGYQCDLYEEVFEDYGWNRVDAEEKTMHTTKDQRQESLWLNYEPPNRDIDPGIDKDADQQTLLEASDE